MHYKPGPLPASLEPKSILDYVVRELRTIARGLVEGVNEVELRASSREPTKPRVGMIVYADGSNWDPGSGEGLYVYKSGGWTFVV